MKENLISFETAKLAYEKGYTREVVGTSFTSTRRNYYNTQGELNGDCTDFIKDILKYGKEKTKVKHVLYPATSQSLLQKWLREVHKIYAYRDWHDYSYVLWDEKTDNVKTYTDENIGDLDKLLQEALKLL